jgi:hypothetical protein
MAEQAMHELLQEQKRAVDVNPEFVF